MSTVAEQVTSGLRLALKLLSALFVLGLLGAGLHRVSIPATGTDLEWGSAMVISGAALLFLTVAYWAKWFFAACCGNAFRLIVMAGLGRTISTPSLVAPRVYFWGGAILFGIMGFLSYRFVDTKPSRVDSICLVGCLSCIVYSMLCGRPSAWMLISASFLLVSFAYDRLSEKHSRAGPAEREA